MSAGISALGLIEEDVTKMLAATTHIGSDNSETTMEQYVWKKKTDGVGCATIKEFPKVGFQFQGEHHQPEEDLGEASAGCARCCSGKYPFQLR